MGAVISKRHVPYGGVVPLESDSASRPHEYHIQDKKKRKKESFPVVYCPECEEVRDKRTRIRYGKEWPMKRQLVHSVCSHCIRKQQENK